MTEQRLPDAVLTLRLDPSGFIRGIHDVGNAMQNMTADLTGKPRPPRKPYPKRYSGMTARQYRASRRAYGRAKRAHKKALRSWQPDTLRMFKTGLAVSEAIKRSKATD